MKLIVYCKINVNWFAATTSSMMCQLGLRVLVHGLSELTHWGRVTHIWVSKLIIIGSDNGLSPGRRQAIIWTNAGILLIGPLGTNFNEILIEIHTFSFMKMHLKMSSGKRQPFCLGLNALKPNESINCKTVFSQYKSMAHCKTVVSLLLMYRNYCRFVLSHQYVHNPPVVDKNCILV